MARTSQKQKHPRRHVVVPDSSDRLRQLQTGERTTMVSNPSTDPRNQNSDSEIAAVLISFFGAEEASKPHSQSRSQDGSGGNSATAGDLPKMLPNRLPNRVPKNLPKKLPKKLPKQLPKKLPNNLPINELPINKLPINKLPNGLSCTRCQSTNTQFDRYVYGITGLQRHSCDDCRHHWTFEDVPDNEMQVAETNFKKPVGTDVQQRETDEQEFMIQEAPSCEHLRAAYSEKGISIKDVGGNGRFLRDDTLIPPPSKRSAKGKEKEFEPSIAIAAGVQNERFQAQEKTIDPASHEMHQQVQNPASNCSDAEHEQSLNLGKQVIPEPPFTERYYQGECSKAAASPSGIPRKSIPRKSIHKLDDDHPSREPEGSLLHSVYLLVLAHHEEGGISMDEIVDYFENQDMIMTAKFPDNWDEDDKLKDLLISNRHFKRSRQGFFINEIPVPSPAKEKPKKFSARLDKNLGENSHASMPTPTGSKAQEKTPDFNLAKPASSGSKLSEDHIEWTPSEENQGRIGPLQAKQIKRLVAKLRKPQTDKEG